MKVSDDHILKVLSKHEIRDQSELVAALELQGHEITQASLSRRLKKLGVHKIDGVYHARRDDRSWLADKVIAVNTAPPNLITVRTLPGHANPFALQLDAMIDSQDPDFSGLIGTIAGDDTILIIVNDPSRLNTIAEHIKSNIHYRSLKSVYI